jgi:ATP-binding cassette subfamily F protein 3
VILQVSGLTKAFGVDEILRGVNFRLDRREKVALVGRNGTGKTTLIRILTGEMESDTGSVHLGRGVKIGYLRQEAQVDTGRSVVEEAEEARKHVLEMAERLKELEDRLQHGPTEDDLEEYAMLHEHFMEAQGYDVERGIRVVLQKMGFHEDEFEKPASALSGGEKTRLALARLLLEEPDLLILDEPTNHLDLQATEWLEGWIRSYPGAVLLVSHDRAFLTNTAERVLDLSDGQVKSYPGPFDKYLKLRSEEEERQAEVARRQQIAIEKLDEYVRRFMNSQRTAQARGRLKMKEKLVASAVHAPAKQKGMKGGFKNTKRSGDVVAECEGLSMGFDGVALYENLDWTVRIGERWGVIGENGSGKSTLIKNLLGVLRPWSGVGRLGSNVEAGYFAQDTTELDPDQSPIDFLVWECDMLPPDARNLLGRFLITGDDAFRPVKTLSGGEKNKLSLARLTHQNPNLVVLDEPTNHLDMDSREALAAVLADFKGTLILVSHDRRLLESVTDHTLDLRGGKAHLFPGSYGEYRRWIQAGSPKTGVPRRKAEPEPEAVGHALTPREVSKEIGRLTKLVEDIEMSIARNEQALKALEDRLASLSPHDDVSALSLEHQRIREVIDGEFSAWGEQSARLEELRALQG